MKLVPVLDPDGQRKQFIDLENNIIKKDLVMQRHAKINDKNRRFRVFMTPLSRRNKRLQSLRQGVTIN